MDCLHLECRKASCNLGRNLCFLKVIVYQFWMLLHPSKNIAAALDCHSWMPRTRRITCGALTIDW
jgi:hypothetical protein